MIGHNANAITDTESSNESTYILPKGERMNNNTKAEIKEDELPIFELKTQEKCPACDSNTAEKFKTNSMPVENFAVQNMAGKRIKEISGWNHMPVTGRKFWCGSQMISTGEFIQKCRGDIDG